MVMTKPTATTKSLLFHTSLHLLIKEKEGRMAIKLIIRGWERGFAGWCDTGRV